MGKNKRRHLKHHGGGNADVNHETDARFWAQTGYKPGMSLDMKDPSDRAMSKVWVDVNARVKREDDMGQLAKTFDDQRVHDHLEHAKVAHLAALNHMVGATQSTDNAHLESHLRAAKEANTIARESCEAAAKFQPESVNKLMLEQAKAEVARTAPQQPNEVPVMSGENEADGQGQNLAPPDVPITTPSLNPQNEPQGFADHAQTQAQPGGAPNPDPWAQPGDDYGTFDAKKFESHMRDLAPQPQTLPQPPDPNPNPQPQPAPPPAPPGKHGHGGHGKLPPVEVRMPDPGPQTQPQPMPMPAPAPPPQPQGDGGWSQKANTIDAPSRPPVRPSQSPRGRANGQSSPPRPQSNQASNGPSGGTVAAIAVGIGVALLGGAYLYQRGR